MGLLQVLVSLVPLEQQVMIDAVCHWPCTHASCLIGIEYPAIPLVFLDCFADILMVLDFDAFVFLQSLATSA